MLGFTAVQNNLILNYKVYLIMLVYHHLLDQCAEENNCKAEDCVVAKCTGRICCRLS